MAALVEPTAPPPENNLPELLRIDESNQAKSGALRLGTSDDTSPFTYQLEVLGTGAQISSVVADYNLKIGSATSTLFVDAATHRVCVGPCLQVPNSVGEVSGRTQVSGGSGIGVEGVSSSAVGVSGTGATYGVQGVASAVNAYGIWAVNTVGTAVEGTNTTATANYSAVAGFSQNGYGIYGSNTNSAGLWAAYFRGRLESNSDVSGSKFLATTLQRSLVPFTVGQVSAQYLREFYPSRVASDGKSVWFGQDAYGEDIVRIDRTTGLALEVIKGFGPTNDLIYDSTNGYIWQAANTYSGRIGRIRISTGVAESQQMLDPGDHGTCPMVSLARDPSDPDILWAVQAAGSCFGTDFHDRLLRFRISTFTADATKWVPLATYDIYHTGSTNPPYGQTPTALVFDALSGNIWISFQGNDNVYRINPANPDGGDGKIEPGDFTAYDVPGPTDLFYDSANQRVWVSADDTGTSSDGAYYIAVASGTVSSRIATYTGDTGFPGPKAITVDGTNVWVATNTGSQTGYVDRFNAASPGAVTHFATNQGASYRDILYNSASRAIWVPSWYSQTITRLDASSGSAVNTFNYKIRGLRVLSYDGTFVWVTDDTKLYKVRAADGFVIFSVTLGGAASSALFDSNYLWATVASTRAVLKLDPYSGSTACSLTLPSGDSPQSVAFDGRYYWVTAAGSGKLYKVNNLCAQVGSAITLTATPNSLGKVIFNGRFLWVLSSADNSMFTVNPATGAFVQWTNYLGTNPRDIFFDNATYWVANHDSGNVTALQAGAKNVCSIPSAGSLVQCQRDSDCAAASLGSCFPKPEVFGTFSTGSQPIAVAFDGTYIWTANESSSLTRLQAADPTKRTDFSLTVTPNGIAFDGTYLWTSGAGPTGYGGLLKLYSGTGRGLPDLSATLTLQNNSPLTTQRGSVYVSDAGRIGGSLTAGGNLVTGGNVWGAWASGDDIGDGVTPLPPNTTQPCPTGHFIKNISVDGSGRVTKIECRPI